jgi:hypothetical protein
VKNALRSITLKGDYLKRLWKEAVQQGKNGRLTIVFEEAGVTLECQVRRT